MLLTYRVRLSNAEKQERLLPDHDDRHRLLLPQEDRQGAGDGQVQPELAGS